MVYAIVLAAGRGLRMGGGLPKQFMSLAGRPLLFHALSAFERADLVDRVMLVAPADRVDRCLEDVRAWGLEKVTAVVAGGERRQDSVAKGLEAVPAGANVIAVHDGARPLILSEQIDAVVDLAREKGSAVLGTPVTDTVKEIDGRRVLHTPDRSRMWQVQTPQAFHASILREAHGVAARRGYFGTDDASLVEQLNAPVYVVPGREDNLKITAPEDLAMAESILRSRAGSVPSNLRAGHGYDVHRLVAGRPLILGGVTIPFDRGLHGHSDADVLSHAVADAILGAMCLGDIGTHFPDDDPAFAGISSLTLLERVSELARDTAAGIINVDATVIAQRPRLAPYIADMREKMAGALGITTERLSVKATTTEGLGFAGTEQGIAAQAIALVAVWTGAQDQGRGTVE
ncbi:MAG: 2-C-methyl-D-erythritol 4-phosphate cytidylyltransferase [Candidatus Latescibacteria bacterium]|nr:2-C-methyl-D-erythritol 4-phosphate cytidylyltransferase [Candidatus Latescibacterota bacterium]